MQVSAVALGGEAARVHAGIYYETDSAPHLVGYLSDAGVGVFVKSHFVAEGFGIESPAFDVCGVVKGFS